MCQAELGDCVHRQGGDGFVGVVVVVVASLCVCCRLLCGCFDGGVVCGVEVFGPPHPLSCVCLLPPFHRSFWLLCPSRPPLSASTSFLLPRHSLRPSPSSGPVESHPAGDFLPSPRPQNVTSLLRTWWRTAAGSTSFSTSVCSSSRERDTHTPSTRTVYYADSSTSPMRAMSPSLQTSTCLPACLPVVCSVSLRKLCRLVRVSTLSSWPEAPTTEPRRSCGRPGSSGETTTTATATAVVQR